MTIEDPRSTHPADTADTAHTVDTTADAAPDASDATDATEVTEVTDATAAFTPDSTSDTRPDTTPDATPGARPEIVDAVEDTRPQTPLDLPELTYPPDTTAALPTVGYAPEPAPPAAGAGSPGVEPFDPSPRRRGPRMRTVVLGLVLAAVSVTSLVRLLTAVHVDDGAVGLPVLIVAGLLLLGGALLAAARDARDGRD